jgi:hypothetical protein
MSLATHDDESLQNDVSADEVLQIVAGWQQYNGVPDYFAHKSQYLMRRIIGSA